MQEFEYIIVSAKTIPMLQDSVCQKLQEGWLPSGGICFDSEQFHQSLMKKIPVFVTSPR